MASRPSHEASTADEALALGRAEHGPDADLHVREIRTGGVGGFFATRRFVAELAADIAPDDDVSRDQNADLDAAIADASAALGTDAATASVRPLTSVPSRRGARTFLAPAPTFSPAPIDASSGTTARGQSRGRSTSPEAAAPASVTPAPTSPFAMALSRMANGPEVTAAVMDVMDGTTGASAPSGTAATVVHPGSASRVVLYSVPQATPLLSQETAAHDGDGSDDGRDHRAVDGAESVSVEPMLDDFNYAAILIRDRGTTAPPDIPTLSPSAADPAPAPEVAVVPGQAVPVEADSTPAVVVTALAAAIPHTADPSGLLPRLQSTGFPAHHVPDLFLHEVGEKGIHTALTRLIKMRTNPAPALPVAPCTVVFIGPGTDALTAAMNACGALRADAAQVGWVGPAHLSNLVPAARRISTPAGAVEWLTAPKRATVVNVIAVHAPVSENIDPHTRAVIAALTPSMVLAVVDATRKNDAVARWVEALDCVDALALENASNTHDPAVWLTSPAAPVALVEGRKATAARWASLLCERLTDLADLADLADMEA